ncbi:MAG: YjgP/YjgQ family permease, partial [Proteobacteria bacterium]
IVAFRSIGLGMPSIIAPALILSILIGILSLQTSFHIAPWGNRQFELLVTKLGSEKPATIVKEATFSEGFFDRVVYANKVNSKTGALEHVFVYDESTPDNPVTVIAREGRIIQEKTDLGNAASLRLSDGSIHRTSQGRHTKIDFSTYDVSLLDPAEQQFRSKTPPSLTIEELKARMKMKGLKKDERLSLETEYHKRIALGVACILFALIGVGLGTTTNRRNAKSGGMVMVVALIIVYYVLYVAAEGAARKGQIPPYIAMWFANCLFTVAAGIALKRAWN